MSLIDTNNLDSMMAAAQGKRPPSFNDIPKTLQALQEAQAAASKKTSEAEEKFLSDFKAERAKVDEKKPEEASKLLEQIQEWKPQKQKSDPIDAFGSIGAAFAMMAAALSKQPMVNALNAGAALLNAQKAGDEKAYEDAFAAWKENTKLALEKHTAMMDDYKAAQDKLKEDFNLGKSELEIQVKKWNDPVAEHMVMLGQWENFFQLQTARQKAGAEMARISQELQEKKRDNDLTKQALAALPANATPDQKAAVVGKIKAELEGRATEAPTIAQDEAHIVRSDAQKLLDEASKSGKTLTPDDALRQATLNFEKDKKEAEKAGVAPGSSARESVMNQRILVDAKGAAKALENLTMLPSSATTGFFSSTKPGTGIFSATKKVLLNKVTTDEVKAYNTIAVGMGRALSGMEVGGLQVNQHLQDQFEKLQVQEGDDHLTAALKLAQMRQDADNALEVLETNPHLAPAQLAKVKELRVDLSRAVPWSVSDAIKLQFSGKPEETFKDYAASSGLEGVTPGAPPQEAVDFLKNDKDPNASANFDAIFGPGAAAKALGK